MDLMRILRSLQDFVYEVMTWLVFYPRTLWLVLRRPLSIMRASDIEQAKDGEEQYLDTLHPVLFLILTLLIVQFTESAIRTEAPATPGALLSERADSPFNLLVMRSIVFGIFPLMFAITFIRRTKRGLDRHTLRPPFMAQCLTGTLFSAAVTLSTILARVPGDTTVLARIALSSVATVWYVLVQTFWFRSRLGIGHVAALVLTLWVLLKAGLVLLAAAVAMQEI